MPYSIEEMAPRETRKTRDIQITRPDDGLKFTLTITYFPNRLTQEPIVIADDDPLLETLEDGEDPDSLKDAIAFCDIVAEWDVTGAGLVNRRGEPLANPAEVIPLEPRLVRSVPIWIRRGIFDGIRGIEFPNENGSRRSRRR